MASTGGSGQWHKPGKAFRVLSLDGGGSWSILQVAALLDLYAAEATLDGRLFLEKNFDLIVTCSGGGIVLGGLLAGMSLEAMMTTFRSSHFLDRIFTQGSLIDRVGHAVGLPLPKYDSEAKLAALQGMLPEEQRGLKLEALRRFRCVIAAFDYDSRRATLFRTHDSVIAEEFLHTTLAEAVHASSNAPVLYFDAPASITVNGKRRRYWDGALAGYNNPVLLGIIEAQANGVPLDHICALSIGTGLVRLPILQSPLPQGVDERLYQRPLSSGTVNDIQVLGQSVTDDPPDAASLNAHVLLACEGDLRRSRLVRLSAFIHPLFAHGSFHYPTCYTNNHEEFVQLIMLEMDSKNTVLLESLAKHWISGQLPNQPAQADVDTFETILGHGTYREGADAWTRLCAKMRPGNTH